MDNYRVAIVGATGIVGQELIRILEQRNFPLASVSLYATDDTVGRTVYGIRHSYPGQGR